MFHDNIKNTLNDPAMRSFNKIKLLISAIFILPVILCLLIFPDLVEAQTQSPDAIAIRIMPNLEHFSALRWYRDKKLSGSPQSMTVDGYEAVRDERTVIVNAANVAGGSLYTNIYIISYNQAAEAATTDIFSQILKHWKFNTNLSDTGLCRKNAIENGNNIFCLLDEDCPIGDNCDSEKARVVRDTRRLADSADIKTYLVKHSTRGYFPKLSAGSYLPNKTLSTWPSWRDEFGRELQAVLPVDPINKLGPCQGFNEVTCWDEDSRRFAASYPDLPNNSFAYAYFTDADGSNANQCAIFESGLNIIGAFNSSGCAEVCLDFDGDGFCFPRCGSCSLDCNDADPAVKAPSGAEACSGGIDDDCDGLTDCDDTDCAGSAACIGSNCSQTGCDAYCPTGCTFDQDPDCGCNSDPEGCCPASCGGSDPDCAASCVPTSPLCNTVCPAGCSVGEDPDCLCQSGNGCCAPGCNITIDSDCAPTCIDMDNDDYSAITGALCPAGNDCDDTSATGFAIHPGAAEVCDNIDNDCNSATADGSGEAAPLNSKQAAICAGSKKNCQGGSWLDDYTDIANYQTQEDEPIDKCSDGIDNDCNGVADASDPNCAGTCFNLYLSESLWYVASENPDCDQCDLDGDQDTDQGVSTMGRDWINDYSGWADRCDPDCSSQVSVAVSIDDFERNNESRCHDGVDNDCDGQADCADTDCTVACLPTCAGGIPANSCPTPPWYCPPAGGSLVENCNVCHCTGLWLCGPAGTYCCDNQCNNVCNNSCTTALDPDCPAGNACCGNGKCEAGESTSSCPGDCLCDGSCNNVCTNATCTSAQDPDCPAGNVCCGDGECEAGETNATCPGDCLCDGSCNNVCSNAICTVVQDPDCPAGTACCGNGTCDGTETNADCPGDCPVPYCQFDFVFPCVFS